MNKTKLSFETSAEIRNFIRKRKISNWKIDTTDITVVAVLTEKDIEIACRDYHAKMIGRQR